MSLYGLLTTSASGMSAESTLLGTVSDNIGNIDTVGYKNSSAEFASMVLGTGGSNYQSGSVLANTRVSIDAQGAITSTTSPTDLAIQGNGFFQVYASGQTNGTPLLTRAGSFVENANGYLVNSAGYELLGCPYKKSVANSCTVPASPIQVPKSLAATATGLGELYLNLDSNAPSQVGNTLPSANSASSVSTNETQLTAYDGLGNQVTLDVYLTNVTAAAPGSTPTWEVDVFEEPPPPATAGFPYAVQLTSNTTPPTLTFDPTSGKLTGVTNSGTATANSIAFTLPNNQLVTLDMSQTTQLATNFTVLHASTDGSAASSISSVSIGSDGTLSAVYQNGTSVNLFAIPLATVANPDGMSVVTGNAFQTTTNSGTASQSAPGAGGVGKIQTSALESSTVDLSAELTKMIEAQNNYQANSKVFETGSKLLQVLVNLQQ